MKLPKQTAKLNALLGSFVAVLGAAAWFQPGVAGSDLWWHLASGREIWSQLAVHTTDPFSYTYGGRLWMNHEWFWDVIYWRLYRVNPQLVAWFNLSVVVVIFSLAFAVALRASGSILGAGTLLWLVAASSHWFLDIRPHLFTLLFVGFFLLTRDRRWAPWSWPVLVVLWANLHSGFVFGVGAIGLYVGVRTLQVSWQARQWVILRREWLGVGLCLLATLVNPYGYHIYEYPLAYLDSTSPFRQIIEWQAPRVALNLEDFSGRFWLVTIFVALGVPFALRRDPYLVALSAVTFLMAYSSRRFIPLFGITSAAIGALAIAAVQTAVLQRVRRLDTPAAGLAASLSAGLLALWLWQDVRLRPNLLERWTESNLYPAAALRYLEALGPPERVLNYYNWGGFIMLHAPGIKVFIDGRANTLYGERIYLDYLALLGGRPGALLRAARYPADAALLPANGAFARALAAGSRPWTVVYTDPVAQILLPPDSPRLGEPMPARRELLGDHPDYLVPQADAAVRHGSLERAERLLRRALQINPQLVRAYGRLAMIAAARRDAAAIRRVIEDGIREVPRRKPRFKQLEGKAYERMGDPARALEAFREAIPYGPFSNAAGMRAVIRRLEQRIAAGTAG